MNTAKQEYVSAMRANTAYPIYRGVIGIITMILMVLAALDALEAIGVGFALMSLNPFVGIMALLILLAFAVLAFYMAKFWNEAAQILADVGDSVMETNMRASAAPRNF